MPDHGSDLFDVETHLERVRRCETKWRGLPVPTATPDGGRYPLVYPRDTAVITKALVRVHRAGHGDGKALGAALEGAARFLASAQGEDGRWGQRYDTEGRDQSIYPQEDNTAHAVATIARHLLHARSRGEAAPWEAEALDAIARGVEGARAEDFHGGVGLYHSTTSIHESALERGFTLWTNGAFWEALGLAAEAARAAGRGDAAAAWSRHRGELLDAVLARLVHEGEFVRSLTDEGEVDARPDITLLAPSYFGFATAAPEAEARAVERLVAGLWHEELGLLCRYPADHDDPAVHLHGGQGPFLSFSCWLAQRHARRGEAEAARRVLERVAGYATREGDLPEHVATGEAFDAFIRREWMPGRDVRKELDEDILLPRATPRQLLEESERMVASYLSGLDAMEAAGDGVVRVAAPHAWTHADFAAALAIARDGDQG